MAQVHIPGWLLFRLEMSYNSQQVINTFSYKYTGPAPGITELYTIAVDWWNAVRTAYQAITPNTLRFLSVTVRDLGSAAGAEATYLIPGTATGALTADGIPGVNTLAVGWRSATVGRFSRGRSYLPPTTEDQVSQNNYGNSYVSLVTTLVGLILNYHGGTVRFLQQVIASRVKVALYDVVSGVFDNFVDAQRRRLTGRGR